MHVYWWPVSWFMTDGIGSKMAFFNDEEVAKSFAAYLKALDFVVSTSAPMVDIEYKPYSRWTA